MAQWVSPDKSLSILDNNMEMLSVENSNQLATTTA